MAKASKPKAAVKATHVVTTRFRDKHNFSNEYNPGDDVSHLDEDRLNDLIKKGLVSKSDEEDEEK